MYFILLIFRMKCFCSAFAVLMISFISVYFAAYKIQTIMNKSILLMPILLAGLF